jgi:hypothetical protein
MSRIMKYKLSPSETFTRDMINVEERVGPRQVNLRDDVRIVQELLRMAYKNDPAATYGLPQVTGRFDAVTGFWIFEFQRGNLTGRNQIIDGIISPAKGVAFAPGGIWTIVALNSAARMNASGGAYLDMLDRASRS